MKVGKQRLEAFSDAVIAIMVIYLPELEKIYRRSLWLITIRLMREMPSEAKESQEAERRLGRGELLRFLVAMALFDAQRGGYPPPGGPLPERPIRGRQRPERPKRT